MKKTKCDADEKQLEKLEELITYICKKEMDQKLKMDNDTYMDTEKEGEESI